MAITPNNRVRLSQFEGGSKVTGNQAGDLASVVRSLLQANARAVIDGLSISAMTDNSGGTAGAEMATVTVPPVFDSSSSGGIGHAAFNTAAGTVMNAYAVLIEHANAMRTKNGMGDGATGSGTIAVSGTVAAVTVSVTGATGDSSASQATVEAAFNKLLEAQRVVIEHITALRLAVGLAAVPVASNQGNPNTLTLAMPTVPAAAAVAAGTSATTGVAKTAVDAALVILANNIAFAVEQIDDVAAAALGSVNFSAYAG